ncbi:eukaryotic translation initiation factor 3subunit I [Striga asiatica]|uniref:Eukaryotic translation initiation factor 3subunit I n=1 Tax=Striga asiatica TaxID=4170 RepID=A0A5A7RKQ6_STRAF|nr:eukaryotic translation initiation factor 3subunit I [Striga asiatica]
MFHLYFVKYLLARRPEITGEESRPNRLWCHLQHDRRAAALVRYGILADAGVFSAKHIREESFPNRRLQHHSHRNFRSSTPSLTASALPNPPPVTLASTEHTINRAPLPVKIGNFTARQNTIRSAVDQISLGLGITAHELPANIDRIIHRPCLFTHRPEAGCHFGPMDARGILYSQSTSPLGSWLGVPRSKFPVAGETRKRREGNRYRKLW